MLIWLSPLVVFITIVLVHEAGHFLAAKAFGVYAPIFSIGFGPALIRKKWGETEYRLSAIPLGGYVKMASRSDKIPGVIDAADAAEEGKAEKPKKDPTKDRFWREDGMTPFGPRPIPSDRWMENKPLPQRLVILLAGVTMNMLLALVVMIGFFGVNGKPDATPKISEIEAGSAASKAGLIKGDSVVSVNGKQVKTWEELTSQISQSADKPITIGVMRAGKPLSITATPASFDAKDEITGSVKHIGRLGVMPEGIMKRVPLNRLLPESFSALWIMTSTIGKSFKGLSNGNIPASQLGGPALIAQVSVQAAESGFGSLCLLIALISVNLAVFNLLPVPIFDGGQVVVTVIESIRGKAMSERSMEMVLRAGVALIILLLVLTTYNDIVRFVPWFKH